MSRGPNLERRKDLEAALERAGPRDEITLSGLATLYGSSKQNFTNVLRNIEKRFDMPAYRVVERGEHAYPARKAIRVLLKWETRNDDVAFKKQQKMDRILGRGARKKGAADDTALSISELAQMSRVMAETEQRERDQGLYVPVAEVAAIGGQVFSLISNFLSDLDANIDPNGILDDSVRTFLRERGRAQALVIHAEMKDMLSGNAIPRTGTTGRARGQNGRARGARARR